MKSIHKIKTLIATFLLCSANLFAQEPYTMPAGQQSQVSSFENPNGLKGNGGQMNGGAKGHAFDRLASGETKTLLESHSPGIIQRIWVTINDRSLVMMRSLRLRMYWDGESKPAVDVPFGDFFCAPLGRATAFQSALFSDPEGRSFNCYIAMPYKKSCKITLCNESSRNLGALYYDIDFLTLDKAPKDMLYFHACWNRERKGEPDKDFELLPKVTGKGRFLGVNVGVNVDSVYKDTWWGEGEVKMYIDGDTGHPTFNGTGTEDYIGTGWGESVFTNLYQGCLVADDKKHQYAFYRFHIPDALYFYQDFRATLQKIGGGNDDQVKALAASGVALKPITVQGKTFTRLLETPVDLQDPKFPQGWTNFYRVDDYCATAYFYLDKPSSKLPELAPANERIK